MLQSIKNSFLTKSPESPKDLLSLDSIITWDSFVMGNKDDINATKAHTTDDISVLKKRVQLNSEKNKNIASRVSVIKDDITKLQVDAIVNSTSPSLNPGGGVDFAINRAAGKHLHEDCLTLGGLSIADGKITSSFDLPAKYIIHTVGPRKWRQSSSLEIPESQLQQCYEKSLSFVDEHSIKSIAFPCIGTGVCEFPKRSAAHIALSTARNFLQDNETIDRIIFCTYLEEDYQLYQNLMQLYFPVAT